MKYIRTPLKADVIKYEPDKGIEDGLELFSDVITKNNVDCNNLVQIEKDGQLVCPYIYTRRGRTFIKENDYIIIEEDGTKLVCGGDKVDKRYALIE